MSPAGVAIGSRVAAWSSCSRTRRRLAPTTTCSSVSATWATPASALATASTGLTVRIRRRLARRATAGSTTVQLPRSLSTGAAEEASRSISSGVSGSPCRATCQLNANICSWANRPCCSGSSRGPAGVRTSRTARVVRSRPRLRGHSTSTPRARSAATPSSSRLTSSSVSRVISSGTRSSSSRSSTGQASAAARSAMVAWVRARSPKPWLSADAVHSTAASHRCKGLRSSWTCRTNRTRPATSSSSSASTRSETVTSWGSSAERAVRARRACSRSSKPGPVAGATGRRGAAGALRGMASATASSTCSTRGRASAAVNPS